MGRNQAQATPRYRSSPVGGALRSDAPGLAEGGGHPLRQAHYDVERVFFREVESLDWRLRRLENSALIRLTSWAGNRVARLYRKAGKLLLRTPLSRLTRTLMGSAAPEERYRNWLQAHRSSDVCMHPSARLGGETGLEKCLISVVIPVYNPNLSWLGAAIESVEAQAYGNWELIVVFDGEPCGEVKQYCEQRTAGNPSIRVETHEKGGISSALNLGLSRARGEYVAFLDQDDLLEVSALSHVAAVIEGEQPDIIYTDEGYISADGAAKLPRFKPAWSPALLLTCMYLGHLLVVRAEAARRLGGFRSAYDGAQDYDLVLRMSEEGGKVTHIPRILYQWRQHTGSTALRHAAKPYSHDAGARALHEALVRRRLDAAIEDGDTPNSYRLKSGRLESLSAALIIPTRNPKLLKRLLNTLQTRRSRVQSSIHVILHHQDGPSDAEIRSLAGEYGARVVEYHGLFNFAVMNNLAAAETSADYLVFLNDDLEPLSEDWLDRMCTPFLREEVGIVGALLRFKDGTIQHSGIVTGIADGVGHAGRFQVGSPYWPWLGMTRNVAAVTGACLAIRRDLFEKLGGFDSRFAVNYNDVDLCLRTRRSGFEVVLNCDCVFRHDEARTRIPGTALHERLAIWAEWGKALDGTDDFYSPHLAGETESIELARVR